MNDGNLIPNSERSPSELREMGRKGGIASGKVRRRNKKLRMIGKILGEQANKAWKNKEKRNK
ncbi:hypothetical protein OCV99_13710 [Dorea acetigenes]|jgi:hypothetical protein|uniref:Uncharacterized protein n=1 Tax=Dorea acetigenes TaxID=2981787 RepID=A0ABT2RQ84_9FIRM|nr:hypothetical protein [Dorea acetigenes]MCU6687573.1 hypothetical protein [Dorea acetigenes]SCJ47893.1 Uncharacterised protein [uncultured Clostridium sp.]